MALFQYAVDLKLEVPEQLLLLILNCCFLLVCCSSSSIIVAAANRAAVSGFSYDNTSYKLQQMKYTMLDSGYDAFLYVEDPSLPEESSSSAYLVNCSTGETGETHADQRGYLECRNSVAKPCRN